MCECACKMQDKNAPRSPPPHPHRCTRVCVWQMLLSVESAGGLCARSSLCVVRIIFDRGAKRESWGGWMDGCMGWDRRAPGAYAIPRWCESEKIGFRFACVNCKRIRLALDARARDANSDQSHRETCVLKIPWGIFSANSGGSHADASLRTNSLQKVSSAAEHRNATCFSNLKFMEMLKKVI